MWGGASPEGSVKFNRWLSENRARVLYDYLSRCGSLPDSLKTNEFLGRDWHGLIDKVEADTCTPYRDETLTLLRIIAWESDNGVEPKTDHLTRIKRLKGGVPYKYMYDRMFPELRTSRLNVYYEKVVNPFMPSLDLTPSLLPETLDARISPMPYYRRCRPFYMDLRTNLLYDILVVPNIGVQFYLGKEWSVVADWMYGWWKSDRRHRYWRIYGGDLSVRRWFGSAAAEKPLTGHHIGIYGQILTYDFEWGGKGYIGGEPGGSLWNRMNWGAGVEYGYSLPLVRRLNLDFTIGLGYLTGRYYTYEPQDNCYVWQSTRTLHWFGPTKLEVSLAWLIGCDNYNRGKGGGK